MPVANFNKNGDYTTVWLEHKVKTIKSGKRKGETVEVFEGSIDTGNGKMIALSFYAGQDPVDVDDKTLFAVNANKWKGDSKPKRSKAKNSW